MKINFFLKGCITCNKILARCPITIIICNFFFIREYFLHIKLYGFMTKNFEVRANLVMLLFFWSTLYMYKLVLDACSELIKSFNKNYQINPNKTWPMNKRSTRLFFELNFSSFLALFLARCFSLGQASSFQVR